MIEWAAPYEAPLSLDAPTMIGGHSKRPAFWTFSAASVAVVTAITVFIAIWFFDATLNLILLGFPVLIWWMVCYIMAQTYRGFPAEHWLRLKLRHARLPKVAGRKIPLTDPIVIDGIPRAVIEVDTLNLRGMDDQTMGERIKAMHAFYIGLKWPVQIVVRAWPEGEQIRRKWYIAVMAPSEEILKQRGAELIAALRRAKLGGRMLNGDLFDSLQECWTTVGHYNGIGPNAVRRNPGYVIVDGECVRGVLLSKLPRFVDANWLSSMLDGDLVCDFGLWLDPIDNDVALDNLRFRVNNWETQQLYNVGINGSNGKLGYRDPALDEQIKDAMRVRAMLNGHRIRVFNATFAFVVRGKTLEECLAQERRLLSYIREHVGTDAVMPLDWEQDAAPEFVVPLGEPPLIRTMEVVSPVLARSYPFSSSSMVMKGGVKCGKSQGSQHDNTLNLWTLMNPHLVILATTGAGKGFWLKVWLWRLLHQFPDRRVWIIQSEKDEYTQLAEAMPSITFTRIPQHVLRWVTDITRPFLEPWPDEPRGKVIRITSDEWPDLTGAQLTVYDLTRMDPELKGEAITRLLRYIEAEAENESKPTIGHVVIDELGIVLHSAQAARAIETAYRRFRSIPHKADSKIVSRRGMIGLSQRPSDLLANPHGVGKVIADLANTKLFLRMERTELSVTARNLNLNDNEQEYLELGEEGDALLVAGRNRIALRMDATEDESILART